MYNKLRLLTLLIAIVAATCDSELPVALGAQAGNTPLTTCSYLDTCSSSGYDGVCVSISAGCCSGSVTSNLCPGSSDIMCCTKSACSTPQGSGTCMQTSQCSAEGGYSVSGYCVGPSDLQCCVSGTPPSPEDSVYGVDVSYTISSSTASCFASSGYSFVIPRGYHSYGEVDTAACESIINAYNAGIKTRDTYLFPCPTCSKSAATQMGELVDYLSANCKSQWSGRIWLDIEGAQYWYSSTTSNKAFYEELVDSCATYGVACGVYASSSQWSALFGSTSYTYGNNLPLWYAHYDNNPSFSDYSSYSFGGWTEPYAKQYQGDVTTCSMGVDKNYAPNF